VLCGETPTANQGGRHGDARDPDGQPVPGDLQRRNGADQPQPLSGDLHHGRPNGNHDPVELVPTCRRWTPVHYQCDRRADQDHQHDRMARGTALADQRANAPVQPRARLVGNERRAFHSQLF